MTADQPKTLDPRGPYRVLRQSSGKLVRLAEERKDRALGVELTKDFEAFFAAPHPVEPVMGERDAG